MKKLNVYWTLISVLILLTGCGMKKETVALDVLNASSIQSDNWYEECISVIADKTLADDKEKCANEIIQHVLDNTFHSIHFSFAKIKDGVEISTYPNELHVAVYVSDDAFQKGEPYFSFEYVTEFNEEDLNEQNNIKDNPELFRIIY